MNATIKHQWTAALRSGEYRQGRENLRTEAGPSAPVLYCCLGVLADLLDPDGWEPGGNLHRGFDTMLGPGVAAAAGLIEGDQDELIYLNDESEWTFSAIADLIDKRL